MTGLSVGRQGDPIIPPAQQRRSLKIINDINKHVKIMRRFDARINNLRLFDDFVHLSGIPLGRSQVEYKDHPQIQLLLQRRDRYQKLLREVELYKAVISGSGASGEKKCDAIMSVSRLEVQAHRELEAMEVCFTNIRKELSNHINTVQKFVADVIRISQVERMIRHKMGTDDEDLTDAAIDAKIEAADGE